MPLIVHLANIGGAKHFGHAYHIYIVRSLQVSPYYCGSTFVSVDNVHDQWVCRPTCGRSYVVQKRTFTPNLVP